ncbi:MAG TPA: VWA domain-containing protein [Acidobacteriota bacterium]|nr:VWA domain-containing protein [Acidobacteriota bacterium]
MKIAVIPLLTLFPFGGVSAFENQDRDAPSFRARVELVNILCSVTAGDQGFVEGLEKGDFEVFEDGVPQEIEHFSFQGGEDAQPLNVVLALDTSGSVVDMLGFQKQAASLFLEEVMRPEKDMAAVVQFDSEINLVQDFTYDVAILDRAIESIRAGGATKLYDAVWVSVEDLLGREVGRRILVILSDGDDTQSQMARKEAIDVAQKNDVVIFGIGVRGQRGRADFGALRQFARETGGLFLNSRDRLSELKEAFDRINNAIKSQYSIGYVPKNGLRDGSFREIEVKVNRRGLKVYHREGYYAPTDAR